ncbi:ThuA domain-containing protein [Mucilaginibacter psychrotolerans]|uniref:ThuA domain-containing protein n=1 Tax=Mucilaginibacter psychrotolerans TaxID=1524096 RepID=A0A4Y8SGH0_9SPHI|nr:ThuA domain-containing protein [Mucilaginibacter psychrotolerans]TFF38008.1 ThuA domain-containing protein [Mucilaginibacter psychrotolerans]
MKKALKIALRSALAIVILAVGAIMLFAYKVTHGFPVSYETEVPVITFPTNQKAALLFSKSTGYRHGESIEAGKKAFDSLAKKNNWFLYSTDDGGVFNAAQLAKFDIVIFNNCTGRLLNDEQQKALQAYVSGGGSWLGIHGAGDNSHQWPWYAENLIGASFSHHPIEKHLQQATVTLNPVTDSLVVKGLPKTWQHPDEWYVFFDNPRTHGAHVIYAIDGQKINPNGNILFVKDKDFGMGKDHPVAWYREVGKGRAYYTSIGHDASAWAQPTFLTLLENELKRSGTK